MSLVGLPIQYSQLCSLLGDWVVWFHFIQNSREHLKHFAFVGNPFLLPERLVISVSSSSSVKVFNSLFLSFIFFWCGILKYYHNNLESIYNKLHCSIIQNVYDGKEGIHEKTKKEVKHWEKELKEKWRVVLPKILEEWQKKHDEASEEKEKEEAQNVIIKLSKKVNGLTNFYLKLVEYGGLEGGEKEEVARVIVARKVGNEIFEELASKAQASSGNIRMPKISEHSPLSNITRLENKQKEIFEKGGDFWKWIEGYFFRKLKKKLDKKYGFNLSRKIDALKVLNRCLNQEQVFLFDADQNTWEESIIRTNREFVSRIILQRQSGQLETFFLEIGADFLPWISFGMNKSLHFILSKHGYGADSDFIKLKAKRAKESFDKIFLLEEKKFKYDEDKIAKSLSKIWRLVYADLNCQSVFSTQKLIIWEPLQANVEDFGEKDPWEILNHRARMISDGKFFVTKPVIKGINNQGIKVKFEAGKGIELTPFPFEQQFVKVELSPFPELPSELKEIRKGWEEWNRKEVCDECGVEENNAHVYKNRKEGKTYCFSCNFKKLCPKIPEN